MAYHWPLQKINETSNVWAGPKTRLVFKYLYYHLLYKDDVG